MKELRIIIQKKDPSVKDTTIKIPLIALKYVKSIVPNWVINKLAEKGIDIKELLDDISSEKAIGKITEIQHNEETIIISIENSAMDNANGNQYL